MGDLQLQQTRLQVAGEAARLLGLPIDEVWRRLAVPQRPPRAAGARPRGRRRRGAERAVRRHSAYGTQVQLMMYDARKLKQRLLVPPPTAEGPRAMGRLHGPSPLTTCPHRSRS